MRYSTAVIACLAYCYLPASAQAQTAPREPSHATGDSTASVGLEEIVVTAERREGSLEKTPVAITALNARALEQSGVRTESDLQTAVAGLTVKATVDSNQLNFALRGQTIDAFTGSFPAVEPYVNEIPIFGAAASGFYDLEEIQVLKGPQGTLFGLNSTGGAVLLTTAKPTNELKGYLEQSVGNYSYHETRGALNIPLISDKLLIRIAADLNWRDGYVYNTVSNNTVGDIDRQSFRLTVLMRPTDRISDTLVADYSRAGGSGTPNVLYSVYGLGATNNGITLNSQVAALFTPFLDTAFGLPGAWNLYLANHPGVDPQGALHALSVQQARGPYVASLSTDPYSRNRTTLVSNVTTFDVLPNLQLKNILGYVNITETQAWDQDGSIYGIESPAPGNPTDRDHFIQYTEELQALGQAFDGALTYTGGVFYYNNARRNTTAVDFFNLSPLTNTIAFYFERTPVTDTAGYLQGTYDLSKVTGVSGLGVTVGGRYTHEHAEFEQLPGNPYYNLPGFENDLSQSFNQFSYQFGIQEQLNPGLLLYTVTRKSFRGGGYNIFAPSTPGTAATAGALFLPEVARDVELGAKFQSVLADMPFRLNLALYNQWVDNVQRSDYVAIPPTNNVAGLTVNVPKAETSGVELDGQIKPASWFEFGGSMAYTDARFTSPTTTVFGQSATYGPYPDAPRWSGTTFAQLSVPLPAAKMGRLTLRGELYGQTYNYFGSLNNTTVPNTRLPGYVLTNFRVGLDEIAGTGLSAAIYVRNAFDRVNWAGGLPTGGVFGSNAAVPGAPRMWYADLRYDF